MVQVKEAKIKLPTRPVRFAFAKTGVLQYISHLDLQRTMAHAIIRAKIPVWYTEGFNKHPYITCAAPLSLGYEGLQETMDFRLTASVFCFAKYREGHDPPLQSLLRSF